MYISKRAKISKMSAVLENAIVLGPSALDDYSIIFPYVVIGFPIRKKIRGASFRSLDELDIISEGSMIGRNVIIRSCSTIYERTVISDNVELGHNVLIREDTQIGQNSLIGSGTIIDGKTKIGNNTSIQSGVYIPLGTVIGNNVFLAPKVVITNDKYPASSRLVTTIIEDNAIIGANATLIAGVKIGKRAVVGAGSVVTKDVPDEAVVYGVPARIVGDRETYEEKKRIYERGMK
jgi:acetyltransferase-like isoleucine patch superfamily enzyme